MIPLSNIENLKAARRRRVAEEISDALKASGMSRKEFAMAMHRQPSEVTKWLSGNHNFTCDLLEEISSVLGVAISGAEELTATTVVDGYNAYASNSGEEECELHSPSSNILSIELPDNVTRKLKEKAAGSAMTFREYVRSILLEKSEEKSIDVMDLCGSCPDFPSAEEIRSFRTTNTFPELP